MSTTMDNLLDGSKTQADRLKEEERSARWAAPSGAHDPACKCQGATCEQGPTKPVGGDSK